MADQKGGGGPAYGIDGEGGVRPESDTAAASGTAAQEARATAGVATGASDDTGGLTTGGGAGLERQAETGGNEARANALGDRVAGSTAGAGTSEGFADAGDPSAMSSDTSARPAAAGLFGDAGAPGGMDGARAGGGTGTDRPPGGVSPLGSDGDGGGD
jgi:hypothetical protein